MTQQVEEQDPYQEGPKGIVGWTLLPVIGLFLTPIYLVFYFITTFFLINSSEWEEITTPGGQGYHSLFMPSIYLEIGFNALFMVFCIYLIVLLFQKKKLFPKLIIIYYIVSVVADIIITVLVNQINTSYNVDPTSVNLIGIISSVIWIQYFRKSKRVKNTFVNE